MFKLTSKCICGNPEMGFDCVCQHVEENPGNLSFSCEFCGLYNASSPRCTKCEVDEALDKENWEMFKLGNYIKYGESERRLHLCVFNTKYTGNEDEMGIYIDISRYEDLIGKDNTMFDLVNFVARNNLTQVQQQHLFQYYKTVQSDVVKITSDVALFVYASTVGKQLELLFKQLRLQSHINEEYHPLTRDEIYNIDFCTTVIELRFALPVIMMFINQLDYIHQINESKLTHPEISIARVIEPILKRNGVECYADQIESLVNNYIQEGAYECKLPFNTPKLVSKVIYYDAFMRLLMFADLKKSPFIDVTMSVSNWLKAK